ncbi:MAG: NAD(P)/FAD-dependent oxidoreductase [Bacteroidetes bacterium]|nr:NAD(P)/FAD-dependent oxidoreductase [Bacteroidota bacterium]
MNRFDTIIIGGGPAGIFAAINCDHGDVLLLERNEKPGKKLLIAGSGRCNITHEGQIKDFYDHYGKNGKFLKVALHTFTNIDLINFFSSRGLNTITDKNGKVFPYTERSGDVLSLLLSESAKKGVQLRTHEKVTNIGIREDFFKVISSVSEYRCRKLVIATGGLSYPKTGSTGDGYLFARQLGHTIVPTRPSLTPVFVSDFPFVDLAGVSLTDRKISIFRENRKIDEHTGDIGFTHKGLSGPGILDFSRSIMEKDELRINFLDISSEELRNLIIESTEKQGKATLQTFFKSHELPRSLVKALLDQAGIDPECTLARVTRDMRNCLIRFFCECSFKIDRVGGYNMAMVTTGGVNLDEINPKNMESRLVPNLFFIGEVLDIDGDTGGYNLQAAFSTGYLAAQALNSRH